MCPLSEHSCFLFSAQCANVLKSHPWICKDLRERTWEAELLTPGWTFLRCLSPCYLSASNTLMGVNSQSLYAVRSWYPCDLPGLAFLSPNLILPVNLLLNPHVSARYASLASTHRNKVFYTRKKKSDCCLECPGEESIEIFSTEISPQISM